MIHSIDRVQVVVQDPERASAAWRRLFGAEPVREDALEAARAHRTVLALGASEVELLRPTGPGPAADHLGAWGEGLFAAGLATTDLAAIRKRLAASGIRWTEEGEQLFVEPSETRGLRLVIGAAGAPEPPAAGPLRRIYEVTQLVRDWKQTAGHYAEFAGLNPDRFCEITSERYGYTGSLLLFDPPARLDRIELCEVTDPGRAMGRFFRRRGESLYMCYAECDDTGALVERLRACGARFSGAEQEEAPPNLFVHPSALCGVLLGVSRTHHAWTWSGRPELARGSGTKE
ncbi:MAG: VOC family protein [Myxococcales bacterium]|nr:VOC family protein [Myxococcales bacterium]